MRRGARAGLAGRVERRARLRVLGPQHAQDPAQLGEGLQRVLPDAREILLQLVRRVLDEVRGDLRLDGDHGHVVGDHVVQLARDAAALLQHGAAGPLLGGERGLLHQLGTRLASAAQGGAEDDDDREQDDGELPGRLVVRSAHQALDQVGGERGQAQRLHGHPGADPQGEQQQDEHVADDPGGRPGPGELRTVHDHLGPHREGPHQHGGQRQPPRRDRPPQRAHHGAGLGEGDHETQSRLDPAVVTELGGVTEQHAERGQTDHSVREPAQPHRRRQRVRPPGPQVVVEHRQQAPDPARAPRPAPPSSHLAHPRHDEVPPSPPIPMGGACGRPGRDAARRRARRPGRRPSSPPGRA